MVNPPIGLMSAFLSYSIGNITMKYPKQSIIRRIWFPEETKFHRNFIVMFPIEYDRNALISPIGFTIQFIMI